MSHEVNLRCSVLLVMGACLVACNTSPRVRPGIEVLLSDSLHLLADARVGLLTNQTGVGRDGSSDVELLLEAGVALTALFSPEHGFRGVLDDAAIGHRVDSATGLPIYSLYGDTRSPTPEMLDRIDVLAIDLQDIGARTYTYISTVLLAMRAARGTATRIVILDRPNPIGGMLIQGPLMTSEDTSFVGVLRIPMRHGLTLGELALYGNDELGLGADLTVVPAAGWRRAEWFDDTGLPWVRPSPSMPDLESATHYPGLVLFEATNLSVGRGTPIAFQIIAAPWLRPSLVVQSLTAHRGVAISDTVVTPNQPPDGKYGGVALPALRLVVTDREAYNPVEVATDLLAAVYAAHGDSLTIRASRLRRLAGNDALRQMVVTGGDLGQLWARWLVDGETFAARRKQFLLYH